MRKIRGNKISMIFQEPMTSLNPVYNLSYQISEAIILHQKRNKTQARKIAVEMLDLVGIPEPNKRIDSFPHELSGGMRQRAMTIITCIMIIVIIIIIIIVGKYQNNDNGQI